MTATLPDHNAVGEVYLLDWGLALALSDEAAEHLPRAAMSREVAGTLAYAAPEMIGAVDSPVAEQEVVLVGGSTRIPMVKEADGSSSARIRTRE